MVAFRSLIEEISLPKSIMASLCMHSTRKVPCRRGFRQKLQREMPALCRFGHSQSLWEELLGRKIEASAAKRLEDAFLEYKVRKSVPSWLPFFPNCSFWIPSNEHTVKQLQILAQRLQDSRTCSEERPRAGKPASQLSDNDKADSISTATVWSLIYHTDRLLSHVEPPAETANQLPTTAGTIIEAMLDANDNTNGNSEGEVKDIAKKKKVKGFGRCNANERFLVIQSMHRAASCLMVVKSMQWV